MKWTVTLEQPWWAFKVRAAVCVRYSAEDVLTIAERSLQDDLVYDANPKGKAEKRNIWTIHAFFPEGRKEERFDDWSQAHAFKEKMDAILAKLNAKLGKLALPPEVEPEPEPTAPRIAEEYWLAHALLMALVGAGKTNAMAWRFLQILPDVIAGRASAIVMEPKGTLIARILSLAQLYDMKDRVVLIDPEHSPVSVNIFARTGDRNGALAMANYVLDTMASTLTANHRQVLQHVTQLMFALPEEPWMGSLLDVLRNGAQRHKAHFGKLTSATRDFFLNEFDREHSQTHKRRQELLGRFQSLLGGETFDRLLYRNGATFNLLDAMQQGSLILINANEAYLGFGEQTKLFGQFWTAQIYKAGLSRFRMLAQGKTITPCWVFLDEAQTYVADDVMFGNTLDKLREAKVGIFAAMHYLNQIDSVRVRSAIDTNTALKFSAIPHTDRHWQCDAPRVSQTVRFPFVGWRELPKMTAEQKREVIELSRSRFESEPHEEPSVEETPKPEQSTDDPDDRGEGSPL